MRVPRDKTGVILNLVGPGFRVSQLVNMRRTSLAVGAPSAKCKNPRKIERSSLTSLYRHQAYRSPRRTSLMISKRPSDFFLRRGPGAGRQDGFRMTAPAGLVETRCRLFTTDIKKQSKRGRKMCKKLRQYLLNQNKTRTQRKRRGRADSSAQTNNHRVS
jgi:hypothetical protein